MTYVPDLVFVVAIGRKRRATQTSKTAGYGNAKAIRD